MFCIYCGNKLPERSAFCNACGQPVGLKEITNNPTTAPKPQGNASTQKSGPIIREVETRQISNVRLIYSSEGISARRKLNTLIAGIVLAVVGVLLIIIANIKTGTTVWTFGQMIKNKHYLFQNGVRTFLIVFGIICIAAAAATVVDLPQYRKNWFKLYEDHLEGCSVAVLIFVIKRQFSLRFSEIDSVQMSPMRGRDAVITFSSGPNKYGTILFKKTDLVFQYIQAQVRRNHKG